MDKRYNLSNYQAKFTDYLLAENISSITLKNYRSDLKHFFSWLGKYGTAKEISEMITFESIVEYKKYSTDNETPTKTINRRLSTIRKFCTFCISQGWLNENPAKKVINITTKTAPMSPEICGAGITSRNVTEEPKIDILMEFKEEFPSDFANLADFLEIINYPQFEGKTN